MVSRRKGWESLDNTYRKRLERGGITKESYSKGANLQAARGQKIEAIRTRVHLPGQSFSTIERWKQRAIAGGVKPADRENARRSAPFPVIRAAIIAKEQAHKDWKAVGAPNKLERAQIKAKTGNRDPIARVSPVSAMVPRLAIPGSGDEGFNDGYGPENIDYGEEDYQGEIEWEEYEDIDPMEWGDSWGYYH